MCDTDQDGILTFEEFKGIQRDCFGEELDDPKLQAWKDSVVQLGVADGLDDKGFNIKGFLVIFHILLRGGSDSIWTILRHFKINDAMEDTQIDLTDATLKESLAEGVGLELTLHAYQFLEKTFGLVTTLQLQTHSQRI